VCVELGPTLIEPDAVSKVCVCVVCLFVWFVCLCGLFVCVCVCVELCPLLIEPDTVSKDTHKQKNKHTHTNAP